jgi:putative ABC transport system permease protein
MALESSDLADRIKAEVTDVRVYTGKAKGDVEVLDSFGGRTDLMALSASFAGVAMVIALFVVASTLSLSITQRRQEFAMLRAVGTSPRQIHQMVGREVCGVAGVAAVVGAIPGYWLANVLGAQFTRADIISHDLAMAYGPLPAVTAIVLCLITALSAAAISARRPAKIAPVDALREATVETPALGRGRATTGLVLMVVGVLASLMPVFISGLVGLAAVGGAIVCLIVAVGLVGPWIVDRALGVFGPMLRRSSSPSVVLADSNARGYTRRLSSAIVPLALAITFGCVQLFMATTVSAEAETQAREGILADFLVAAPASGISALLTEQFDGLPGVTAVNPIARSSLLYGESLFGEVIYESHSVQGIDPYTQTTTLDLRVTDGSLEALAQPNTIALSRDFGGDVGDSLTVTLGDGTDLVATVVATYGRGLGFGDFHDVQ